MRLQRGAEIAETEISLQPRHWRSGEHLPPLVLTPPKRGGWTLARAAKASRDYARAHRLGRAGALCALKAIEAHGAPGLGDAYVRDRWANDRDLLAVD